MGMRFRAAIVVLLLLGVSSWFFPLFRIVRLDDLQARQADKFSPPEFAAKLWTEKLPAAMEQPLALETLLAALKADPEKACDELGRNVGVSRTSYFIVQGTERIEKVEGSKGLVIADGSALVVTGMLFGNTIRDSTGMVTASDFEDSQDFNAVSTELNSIAEKQVIAPLAEKAAEGKAVSFVACAQVGNRGKGWKPLKLIPLQASVEEP